MPRTNEGYHYDVNPPIFGTPKELLELGLDECLSGDHWAEDHRYRVVLIPEGMLYQLTPCTEPETL